MYYFVVYLYVNGSGLVTSLGKRELICLLSFTCNFVVFVWRGFLFLWVLGMGYVVLLWHSLSLPYNFLNYTSSKNSQIQHLLLKHHEISSSKTVIYRSIPSHIGIYGNEKVDKNAKESLNLDQTDFKLPFNNFSDGDVPQRPSYGVYISQLIRFARASSHVSDFNNRNKFLTAKLLKQGYRYHKLRKAFSKFYRRHFELVEKYHVSLKKLMQQGICNPEFYGDLVYKFKKIIGNPDFSNLLKRIVNRFKRAGYSLDIMRQTASLVFNPIMVEGYAALFSCTAVVQASDSMTASMGS